MARVTVKYHKRKDGNAKGVKIKRVEPKKVKVKKV